MSTATEEPSANPASTDPASTTTNSITISSNAADSSASQSSSTSTNTALASSASKASPDAATAAAAAASPAPSTMQAVVFSKYGSPAEVVSIVTNHPTPKVKPHQVLIKIEAASCNPVDTKTIKGDLQLIGKVKFPHIPGKDGSGRVIAVGAGVSRLKVGDEVYFSSRPDLCFAQFVSVEEQSVAVKPSKLNWNEAAAVPIAAQTALGAFQEAHFKEGQKVVIIGASGGVGSFAVQIAKALGASNIAAVCSGQNADFVKSLGADPVVDYTNKKYGEELKGQNYDLVLDCVGGVEQWNQAGKVLKKGGKFLTIVGDKSHGKMTAGAVASVLGNSITRKAAGLFTGHSYIFYILSSSYKLADTLTKLIEEGKVKVHLQKVYDWNLQSVHELFKAMESGRTRGKIVLSIPEGGQTEAPSSASTSTSPSQPTSTAPVANATNPNNTTTNTSTSTEPAAAGSASTSASQQPVGAIESTGTSTATAHADSVPASIPASAASTTEMNPDTPANISTEQTSKD